MLFRQLFDRETCTYTYLLADRATRDAVLIDSVIEHVDRDLQLLAELGLRLAYAVETHVHADHVTGAGTLRERTGCHTVVSRHAGAACADRQAGEGSLVPFGRHVLEARETPGHTSTCISWITEDRAYAFTGDTLLVRGCGRTDFQQGSAPALYESVHTKLFTLPEDCRVQPAHDYQGRTYSTIGEEIRFNPRLGGDKSVRDFVEIMGALNLAQPKKIAIAIAVAANLSCGIAVA